MWKRRQFLTGCGATAAMALSRRGLGAQAAAADRMRFASAFMEMELSANAPEFSSLNIDGLGQGMRGKNLIGGNKDGGYKTSGSLASGRVEYRVDEATDTSPACWTFEASGNRIVLTSLYSGLYQPPPMQFQFDLGKVHTTVLGLFSPVGMLNTPALMHLPGQGSMRLTSNVPELGMW